MWRVAAVGDLAGVTSYADYFPKYRSPFQSDVNLVLGFAIAWMSRQSWSSRISRPIRPSVLFWGGAARRAVLAGAVGDPDTIDARTIVLAPALIGLCFGAMVLAVSGSGSYSAIVGRAMWQPLATGSYTLYLTHMMVLLSAALRRAVFRSPKARRSPHNGWRSCPGIS